MSGASHTHRVSTLFRQNVCLHIVFSVTTLVLVGALVAYSREAQHSGLSTSPSTVSTADPDSLISPEGN